MRSLIALAAISVGGFGVACAQSYMDINHPVHVNSYYKPSTGQYVQEHWRALPGNAWLSSMPGFSKPQDLRLPHVPTGDSATTNLNSFGVSTFSA